MATELRFKAESGKRKAVGGYHALLASHVPLSAFRFPKVSILIVSKI
jgi:hypothetical protein